ncbi:MAG TPA: FGGY family carbohydrate kinase [Symbiobacteriaceae bacterium]|nr:FGGY family carbohydrate kinase [Symbiobacteriaceae bacterium]
MPGPYLIGVDIGTSGTRAGVVDAADGRLVAVGAAATTLIQPRPDWVEQEMEEFYTSACHAIRQAMEQARIAPGAVAAVAIAGQMAGLGFIDEDWRPVTRYDSWLDTRCAPQVQQLAEHAGPRVLRQAGAAPTNAHGAKLLWWMKQAPQQLGPGVRFVMPGGYVTGKLTGLTGDQAYVDATYLHFTAFADNQALRWDEALQQELRVPSHLFPRIVQPWEMAGGLTPEAARDCGLLVGTPVAMGAGDTAASLLGAGVTRPGVAVDVAGTAAVLAVGTDRFRPDTAAGTLLAGRGALPDLWYSLAYVAGGGLTLRWFRDQFGADTVQAAEAAGGDAYERLIAEATGVEPGAAGLLFVPHLGGRICPPEPALRGAWVGAAWGHTRAHFARAVLEGMAYEYDVYQGALHALAPDLQIEEIRGTGGGARSAVWNQIKADVLGVPYVRLAQAELAVVGAAVVAGAAVRVWDDPAAAAARFARLLPGSCQPDPARHSVYQRVSARYGQLLETLRPFFAAGNASK